MEEIHDEFDELFMTDEELKKFKLEKIAKDFIIEDLGILKPKPLKIGKATSIEPRQYRSRLGYKEILMEEEGFCNGNLGCKEHQHHPFPIKFEYWVRLEKLKNSKPDSSHTLKGE